jgi:hypothetical protein
MIGRKLFLIGKEAGLPFILIGRNIFDHCLKDMLIPVRGKRQLTSNALELKQAILWRV